MIKRAACVATCVALSIVGLASQASADPITLLIGTFSYDEFIPRDEPVPGTNAFGVGNFTGENALLDANATTPILFSSLVVTLTSIAGDIIVPIADALVPGPLLDAGTGAPLFTLQFPDTAQYTSARLDGSVDVGSFLLPDGRLFTADSLIFSAVLSPSGGMYLSPGDVVGIELAGNAQVTTAPVPEPASLTLLASGGLSLLYGYRRRRARAATSV